MTDNGMGLVHVIQRLQQARQRVASGWPSVALALAGPPTSTAMARLQEAEEAKHTREELQPWVLVLMESLALVEEARELWGSTPDAMPPMTADLAPCGRDLRLFLAAARATAEKGPAWEDSGGLSRAQGLCVLHLAVCLAEWRMLEMRADTAAAKAQLDVERERQERAAVAAKAIWGGAQKRSPEPVDRGPRSLRDLASVSAAFDQWEENDD